MPPLLRCGLPTHRWRRQRDFVQFSVQEFGGFTRCSARPFVDGVILLLDYGVTTPGVPQTATCRPYIWQRERTVGRSVDESGGRFTLLGASSFPPDTGESWPMLLHLAVQGSANCRRAAYNPPFLTRSEWKYLYLTRLSRPWQLRHTSFLLRKRRKLFLALPSTGLPFPGRGSVADQTCGL